MGVVSKVRGLLGKASHADAYQAGLARAKAWAAETGLGYDGMLDCFGSIEHFLAERPPREAKTHPAAYRRGVLAGFGQPTRRKR